MHLYVTKKGGTALIREWSYFRGTYFYIIFVAGRVSTALIREVPLLPYFRCSFLYTSLCSQLHRDVYKKQHLSSEDSRHCPH